tara:strand:+ start:270 stop:458 length:189 start_codon:yes stop_codon:yes gene_type:complete
MLEKAKASKTVYPDKPTEDYNKKGFFMQIDETLLRNFKVRTTENSMTMTECITKFIETYTGQ